ncbi:unnamed protein product [Moneuplotes crassus]|uniref:Uncharacterized protein n=1 Tax=Euplotes crassus TaxID=5936 RepID=A0AAD1ULR8_EUPCR|nr:unnamed protein product [Moneuplotes crassus]
MNQQRIIDRLNTAQTMRRPSLPLSEKSSEVRLEEIPKQYTNNPQKPKQIRKIINKPSQEHPLFIMAQSENPIIIEKPHKNKIEDVSDFNADDEEFERIDTILTISSVYNDKKSSENNKDDVEPSKMNNYTPGPCNNSANSLSIQKFTKARPYHIKNYEKFMSKRKVKHIKSIPKSEARLRSLSNKRYPSRLYSIQNKYRNIRFGQSFATSRKTHWQTQEKTRAANSTGRNAVRLHPQMEQKVLYQPRATKREYRAHRQQHQQVNLGQKTDLKTTRQQMSQKKSLKNYLNAIRKAKINIHKFSIHNKSKITKSYATNKSIEGVLNEKREVPSHKKEIMMRHHNSTNEGRALNRKSRSPYRAEAFRMHVLKNRRPKIPKSNVVMSLLSRNRTSATITRLLEKNSKSSDKFRRLQ